jgi:Uma2 family endonuclease
MLTELEQKYFATDPFFGEEKPYQIIGGEIIMTPMASPFHQGIAGNLTDRLRPFVRSNRLGKILNSVDILFNDDEVYQPDLSFVKQSKIEGVKKDKIETLPDLVVEILSPSNAYYDLSHKKAVYAQYGVEEYWIIDPIAETIEILVNENGLYRTEALLRKPASLESAMFPGFSMTVEEVFEF